MRLGTSRRRSSATAGDVTATCVRWSTEPAILLAPCRRSAAIVDACKQIGIRRHESPPLTGLRWAGKARNFGRFWCVPCGIWDCFLLRVRVPRSPAFRFPDTRTRGGLGWFLELPLEGAGRYFVFSRTARHDRLWAV
jgi:hypothetical protein